ncbi:uncharacterized protein N7484_008236 [Penicillium longicatenatum]|uniref:uncharacterized protein n=1 Tax=Penicillium longicatenatum TaxID=1561947 RepID=UPI0025482EA8|nr:uncharacterized protein N7484_008236 [Penicillium longicatenatum]KAJ5640374.1 hypothetical protein N7484_008236 [Penicillium longicatenatum]
MAIISRYYYFLKGRLLRGRRKRAALKLAKKSYSSPEPSQQDILLVKAENYIKKAKKPRRCF